MASNGGVSQWDPTLSGTPFTLTLPGAIRADSREYTVATLSQVRNLLGWQCMKGLAGPTTKMLIVPCSISSIVQWSARSQTSGTLPPTAGIAAARGSPVEPHSGAG